MSIVVKNTTQARKNVPIVPPSNETARTDAQPGSTAASSASVAGPSTSAGAAGQTWHLTINDKDDFTEQLCQIVRPHVQYLAMRKPDPANIPSDMEIAPDPATSDHKWYIVKREPTINNFRYYVHFKVGTNNLGDYACADRSWFPPGFCDGLTDLITESMIKGWSKVKELTVVVYKYGDQINTNSDLDEFEKEHVRDEQVDRAGAPALSEHESIAMELLQLRGNEFVVGAHPGGFWLWAAVIAAGPQQERRARIERGQPPQRFIDAEVLVSRSGRRAAAEARERIRRARVAMTEDQCIILTHINTLRVYHERVRALHERANDQLQVLEETTRGVQALVEDMNALMADIDGALNRADGMQMANLAAQSHLRPRDLRPEGWHVGQGVEDAPDLDHYEPEDVAGNES
ncbi:hypothetical protein GGF32_002991 [Allomyces javanicus]|nr:hypothetical protein GGF32_002991 [Allomyces javanicus]